MKVFVYYNLHKKLWSVKALSGPNKGRVVHHARVVELQECKFKVSEPGRQRVLNDRRKNVHAGVVGTLIYCSKELPSGCYALYADYTDSITYNPYKYEKFYNLDTDRYVDTAHKVNMFAPANAVPIVRGLICK